MTSLHGLFDSFASRSSFRVVLCSLCSGRFSNVGHLLKTIASPGEVVAVLARLLLYSTTFRHYTDIAVHIVIRVSDSLSQAYYALNRLYRKIPLNCFEKPPNSNFYSSTRSVIYDWKAPESAPLLPGCIDGHCHDLLNSEGVFFIFSILLILLNDSTFHLKVKSKMHYL